jgi:hypothetical protein
MLDTWERKTTDEVLERVQRHGGDVRTRLRLAGALTFSSELLPIDLAVRDWARRDHAVAERLRRVDNRRMDYLRLLFAAICPARLLPRDRPSLPGRRSRRTQPRRRAGACRQVARGLATL